MPYDTVIVFFRDSRYTMAQGWHQSVRHPYFSVLMSLKHYSHILIYLSTSNFCCLGRYFQSGDQVGQSSLSPSLLFAMTGIYHQFVDLLLPRALHKAHVCPSPRI